MSSTIKKQNNPKKKGEFFRNLDISHSDFHEKLKPIGANNRLSYLNKQGPVCTRGSTMANYPENSASTSGTSYKGGEIVKLGSSLRSHHDTNKKLSIIVKQKTSAVLKTNVLDSSPTQARRGESGNKCAEVHEAIKKRKRKGKRSKNNSVKTETDVNTKPHMSGSLDFSNITNTSRAEEVSSCLDIRRKPCSGKIITTQALVDTYNPFCSGKIKNSSEVMKTVAGLNPVKDFKGNRNVSMPTTSSRGNEVPVEAAAFQSSRKKTFYANRKKRLRVNVPLENHKKDLSQAALVDRYNRTHPNKVRDLSEAKKNYGGTCTGTRTQKFDYLRERKLDSHFFASKRNENEAGPSAVDHKHHTTRGVFAARPLSSSRFNPPPVICFKSSSSCSVVASSAGPEVPSEFSLPDYSNHQDDAYMEWEDIEDEKVLQDIKVHRQNYQDLGNHNRLIEDMETNCLGVSEDNSGDCLIVLDTNILILHLKFVEELSKEEYKDSLAVLTRFSRCSLNLTEIGCPVLVIPWMVLKELDDLKSGPNECKTHDFKLKAKARSAAHFINRCFSSHHSRIKGQSAFDDKEHHIAIDVPDDSILNCCLQLQMKEKRVILLSNDVNFCNKAMATGILSYGKEQMKKALHLGKLDFSTVKIGNLLHGPSSSLTEAEKQCNQTVMKFKILLQEFLSKFIETEMKRVFKDWWIKVIYIKPPWSLLDSLTNMSKHWVAVFGFVMNKSGQKVIEGLTSTFKTEGSYTGSLRMEAEKVMLLAVELCDTIISDNYQPMALEYKNSLMSLLKVLKECKEGDAEASGGPQVKPENSQVPQLYATQSDNSTVLETFQLMWNLVNNFCGVVCDTLGIGHGISYEKPETFPSVEEMKGRLPEAFHYVNTIVTCISSILETPKTELSVDHPTILALHTLIQSVVPSEFLVERAITSEKLLMFCIHDSKRTMLMTGLTQFKEVQMLLLKVLDYIK